MEPVIENNLREIGIYKIAGIDEAGRGSVMGPVVVACVMLPTNHRIVGLNDSKKIPPKKREVLAEEIYKQAIDVQIAECSNVEIDRINILNATKKCILTVINNIKGNPDLFVIDGLFNFKNEYSLNAPYQTIPKGDTLSECIAAASIIAKTYRDNQVLDLSSKYPMYGWDKNKGYGTKKHIEAIYKYGHCPLHRKSFTIKGVYIKDI